jgi:apolipoprotein N-acyltransferase
MGFVAFAGILHWIVALSNEEVTIPGLMIPALALIALYLGIFFGLAALLIRLLARWGAMSPLWIAPVAATLFEYLRSLGPLGFPWAAPAYALARVTPLLQISATVGFWGLVLAVLLVNALCSRAFCPGNALPAARPCGMARAWARAGGPCLAVLLIAAVWIHGRVALDRHPADEMSAAPRAVRVLVAQPDIRREIKWKPEKKTEVVEMILDHARRAAEQGHAAGGFDLFVWPETVLPTRLFTDGPVLREVTDWIAEVGVPVLLGTQEGYWGKWAGRREWVSHNSALVLYPNGMRSPVYRKMRLVPFSERFPLQKMAPWLRSIDFGQSNFFPGTQFTRFELPVAQGAVELGCLICFESAFPEMAHSLVRGGADILVNITNDFWFGRSAGPAQHAEMAIHRAVENRVPVIRCANTGISFLVDPWGRVSYQTEPFVQTEFVGTVVAGTGSFAARHPHWMTGPLGAWIILCVSLGWWRRLGGRS